MFGSDFGEGSSGAPSVSFEFFPPRSLKASMGLWRSVERLAPLAPDFVSVTYGAGGGARDRTLAAILAIRERARLSIAGHLTCVGASREETLNVARTYAKLGVRRIVALRGDAPVGQGAFRPHPGGYASAAEMISDLSALGGFEIFVAAYPETHPEATSPAADIENLKRKLDAGATSAITQFFFDNEDYFRFVDACRKAGIDAPIIPGMLPIENFSKMCNFAARCGSKVPAWMEKAFANADRHGAGELLSVSVCTEQCDDLMTRGGVRRLHFYTLNNLNLCYDICRALGVAPQPMQIAAACG